MIAEKPQLLFFLPYHHQQQHDVQSRSALPSADAVGKPGRMQPGKQRQSRRQDDDGLSDVWFESKPKRKSTRKSQEDSFW